MSEPKVLHYQDPYAAPISVAFRDRKVWGRFMEALYLAARDALGRGAPIEAVQQQYTDAVLKKLGEVATEAARVAGVPPGWAIVSYGSNAMNGGLHFDSDFDANLLVPEGQEKDPRYQQLFKLINEHTGTEPINGKVKTPSSVLRGFRILRWKCRVLAADAEGWKSTWPSARKHLEAQGWGPQELSVHDLGYASSGAAKILELAQNDRPGDLADMDFWDFKELGRSLYYMIYCLAIPHGLERGNPTQVLHGLVQAKELSQGDATAIQSILEKIFIHRMSGWGQESFGPLQHPLLGQPIGEELRALTGLARRLVA
jgi:hypothetical protein